MPRLSTRELCLGAGCLVNTNGTWRRAVVINCTRSIGFDIKLIDTGTYDEILDNVSLHKQIFTKMSASFIDSIYDIQLIPYIISQYEITTY